MERELIMMCQQDNKLAAIRITPHHHFVTVIQKICDMLSDIDPEDAIVTYSLNYVKDLPLDNEDDLATMFQQVEVHGLDDIMVKVTDGSKFFVLNETPTICSTRRASVLWDPIPQFCSHKKVKLLSSDWSEGITTVGQRFEGGALKFKNVLRKFAVERGFEYSLVKNDKVRVTAQCKYKKDKFCMWHVHARILPGNEVFYIKEMDLNHTCGVAVRTLNNPHATAGLVANLVGDDVRAKHGTRAVDVVRGIKKDYGLNISYHQAWWGIEKARGEVFGDHIRSHSRA